MGTLIVSRKCTRAGLDELYGELGEGAWRVELGDGAWWRKEGLEGGVRVGWWCEVIIITSTEALAENAHAPGSMSPIGSSARGPKDMHTLIVAELVNGLPTTYRRET